MDVTILFSTTILLLSLIIIGTFLCLPLFQWSFQKLFRSSLFVKIMWWIPLYIILMLLVFIQLPFAIPLVILILTLATMEYHRGTAAKATILSLSYFTLFSIATFSLILIFGLLRSEVAVQLILVICFASVLSDVCAFFFGNYLSKHPLPTWINPGKSWEGVSGQIVGAFVGACLLWIATGITAPWWLILTIGIASATGDIFNSIVKRQLGIKDWGNTIPGHGGVLDRMSSLSLALGVSFVAVLLVTL